VLSRSYVVNIYLLTEPIGEADCKAEAWWLPAAGLFLGDTSRKRTLPGITLILGSTIVSSRWKTFKTLFPVPSMVNWSLN